MPDAMSLLFTAIGAALDEQRNREKAAREARYNSEEARAARSARSQKAAATRRARRAAAEALDAEREAREPTGPVCGLFAIIPLPHGPQETNCARPPHRHGDHENIDGDRWPTYDEEFEDMLKVTTTHLRQLLGGTQEQPVLFISRDEDTGEPVGLDVWAEALVHHGDVVARQHELKDVVGAVDDDDELEGLLPEYQQTVDEILARQTGDEEIPDDACLLDGEVYPEHDFPPEDEGNDCRRCGAEAEGEDL